MGKNKVKISEFALRNVISESVRNILSELDWKISNSATNKCNKRYGPDSKLGEAFEWLSHLEHYLIDFKHDKETNKFDFDSKLAENKTIKKFLSYIEEMRSYLWRKEAQYYQLADLNDENFKKYHNGMEIDNYRKPLNSK